MANKDKAEPKFNEKGGYILPYLKLYRNNIRDWHDFLGFEDLGKLFWAIFEYELYEPNSFDDSGESEIFRKLFAQIKRNILEQAREKAEKTYSAQVEAANDTNEKRRTNSSSVQASENEPNNKGMVPFKPPSKTAFRDIAFEVAENLINQGRRRDKITASDANKEYDYLKGTDWKIRGVRPIRSTAELKSLLYCLYDHELIKRLDKAGAPNPVVLCAELLCNDELQKGSTQSMSGVHAFAECYNTLSGKWIIAENEYNEWRAAWEAFIEERLTVT